MIQSILRLPDVIQRTGLSRSTIYKAIKTGSFPDRVSLGPRAMGWFASDIEEWIISRVSILPPSREIKIKRRISRTSR